MHNQCMTPLFYPIHLHSVARKGRWKRITLSLSLGARAWPITRAHTRAHTLAHTVARRGAPARRPT